MDCAQCGDPASFRVRLRGEETLLCEKCAERNGHGFEVRLLNSIRQTPPRKPTVCPHCGWTESRLQELGFLGCPLCYEVFKTEILAGFADA